jgi:hypothetical protein
MEEDPEYWNDYFSKETENEDENVASLRSVLVRNTRAKKR